MTDVNMSGRTVTVYGGSDVLDQALGDELGRRGCSTHNVTTSTGWLATSTRAVVRLDTPAGDSAFRALTASDQPRAHIVVTCVMPADAAVESRIDAQVRRCGEQHEIMLIWHEPLEVSLDEGGDDLALEIVPADNGLAIAIVDQIVTGGGPNEPSYAAQTFIHAHGDR